MTDAADAHRRDVPCKIKPARGCCYSNHRPIAVELTNPRLAYYDPTTIGCNSEFEST